MSGMSQVSGRRRRRKFRAASNRVDRISELPEPLKLHILSLLPTTDDRIRTGALSRSWKDLWTCIPKLSFCFDYDLDEDNQWAPDDFVKHIQKTLNCILSCGTKVKEFVVKCPYYDEYSSDVDKWIRFAARNETEKFELDFDPWKGNLDGVRFYMLPEHIYLNSYFRSLRLNLCEVIPLGTTVSWDSLKHLTIDYGFFDNESLAKIVAGAPALEFLDLHLEYGISKLHFGNSVLKKLVMHISNWWYNKEAAFEISAPSVESLEVSYSFETCKMVDMTSLVEATLF